MKKNEPIMISEMDVRPISDEDLRAIAGEAGAAAWSEFPGQCCERSGSLVNCQEINS